jgi:hypothetical protein
MKTRDELLQEYLDQLREQVIVTEPSEYTHARVAMIKDYLQRPSHEQHRLINFEIHWREQEEKNK